MLQLLRHSDHLTTSYRSGNLFCQRTHGQLTQIQDGTKAHLMGRGK